ncbi:MASE4 domain-containing protein [Falsibacillus albus]|uniref:Diguanylate cyclase n=1 Tax=Falsibacillus albus TaxID=2478915 RepID=A0A3L7JPZ8_9BACI|nr:MASE4 domain-containing protein [Falsibacillus albus]RLQ90622.1 diguanylate cyclase [Falsibacillus albus]
MEQVKLPNFFTIAATKGQRLTAYSIGFGMMLLTIVIFPFGGHQLPEIKPFLPAFIALVSFIDSVTSYLFYRQYRVTGSVPLLVLAGTFLYNGLITIPHLLTFPNVFTESGLLGAGGQTAVWFWVAWHTGFPAGILLYLLSVKYSKGPVLHSRRRITGVCTIIGIVLLVAALTICFTRFHEALPAIISGSGYNAIISSGIGPMIWLLLILSIIGLLVIGRMQTILDVWLTLAVSVFFFDVTLTLLGGSRYSIGWYLARINSFISASVILSIFLYEMNRLYALLSEQHQRYQSLFMHNSDPVYSVDKNRLLKSVNNAAIKLLGYEEDELVHQNAGLFVAPGHKEESLINFQKAMTGKPQNYDSILLHKNGSLIDVNITTIPIIIEGEVTGTFGIVKDITLNKKSEQKLKEANSILKELSLNDGLTKLANRRHLDQYLNDQWTICSRNGQSISIILLDIDDFKKFNDSYGHLEGDQCLIKVAKKVADLTGSSGLAARFGGEEMCVVLPGKNAEFIVDFGEKLRAGIQELNIRHDDSNEKVVTVSVGIGSAQSCFHTSVNELIDQADQSLYAAKKAGKNCVRSNSISIMDN